MIYDLSSKLHLKNYVLCFFCLYVHSFECCRFNLILVAFICLFFFILFLYLSASELVECVVDVVEAIVVVSNSESLYCVTNCISNSLLARVVVGAPVVTFCSVNWFLWVNASGNSINAGRIGARIVDDNTNGRSVTISNSNSFWSICSSLLIYEWMEGKKLLSVLTFTET